jgi:PadR family transcriptional regulator PadR
MSDSEWPASWLKGFLELAVLAVIAEGETYGYEISRRLAAAGFGDVKGGTLYPILGRLDDSGMVTTDWRMGETGPGRKYYRISVQGRNELTARTRTWRRFAHSLDDLLKETSDV